MQAVRSLTKGKGTNSDRKTKEWKAKKQNNATAEPKKPKESATEPAKPKKSVTFEPEKPTRSATPKPSGSTNSTPSNLSKSSLLSFSRSSTSKTSTSSSSKPAEEEIPTNDQLRKIHKEKVTKLQKSKYANTHLYKPKLEALVKELNTAIAMANKAKAERMGWFEPTASSSDV